MANIRGMIAKNIAAMLHDGDFVNLGIGIPTMVGNYIPKGISVLLHGENGCIGQDKELNTPELFDTRESVMSWMSAHREETDTWRTGHKDLNNAGDNFITLIPGGCCFDSSISFAMARGGHLDAAVLGGLQVDMEGNLANWMVPGKMINGMGGAMDLASGAKKVIVAMEHCDKKGVSKIRKKCTMPLTAVGCVDVIVTELCIVEVRKEGLVVTAISPYITKEELQEKTEAPLYFADDMKMMLTLEEERQV